MADRPECQGAASNLVLHCRQRQDRAANPVANHDLGGGDAAHLHGRDQPNPVALRGTVKTAANPVLRARQNEQLADQIAQPQRTVCRPGMNRRDEAQALRQDRPYLQIGQDRRILDDRYVNAAVQHPFLKLGAAALANIQCDIRPTAAEFPGQWCREQRACLGGHREGHYSGTVPAAASSSSGEASNRMTVSRRSRRHAPAWVRATPRPWRTRSCVPKPSSSLRTCM